MIKYGRMWLVWLRGNYELKKVGSRKRRDIRTWELLAPNLINILKRNSFPAFVIDNVVKRYLDKNKQDKHSSGSTSNDAVELGDVPYFKLPFIG